jgi:AraC-like DNA-binding protein
MHTIRLIPPAPRLRRYVRFFAQREAKINEAVVVHPVPARAAPLIEFVFGNRFEVLYRKQSLATTTPRTVVVGLQTHCRAHLLLHGAVDSFVILFQPTGLHRLFSIPMHELTDCDYEAHSVLGTVVSSIEQRLSDCQMFEDRVRIADAFLLHRSLDVSGCDRFSATANQMLLRDGDVQIAGLARNAGLSVRQFERRFLQEVGVRPKLYARIARFEAALDSKARSSTKSWTDVAHEFGYYDQMHMVHDFADFTGETPTNTLSQLEMIFREHLQAIRSRRFSVNAGGDPRLIL